jgi:hypothetical protein
MPASSHPSLALALHTQTFKRSIPKPGTRGVLMPFKTSLGPPLKNSAAWSLLPNCSRASAAPVPHTSRETLQHCAARCLARKDATQKPYPLGTQRGKDLPPCSRAIPHPSTLLLFPSGTPPICADGKHLPTKRMKRLESDPILPLDPPSLAPTPTHQANMVEADTCS